MRAEYILKGHPFGNALMFFAARFLPIAALIVAVTLLLGLTLNHAELEKLKLNQLSFLNLGEQVLRETVDQSLDHLRGLLHEPAINRAFEHPAEVASALMAEHLQTLMYRNPIYDKARWLSAAGQELVRINREGDKPVVVPLAGLQDKSARYYYRDAIRLPPGHIYLSPLDLNVEREVVEVPYKPMIRIAIRLPVVAGRDQGLLVVNLRAQILLDHLRRLASREPEHGYMLLNPQGFWLMGPDPQETWGFMFGRDTTLAQQQPLEWGQIASEHHGQIRTADGLWSWITFHPEGLDPETIQAAEHWKLVTQVPAAEIQDLLWQHSRPLILIAAITLALFGAGIVLYRQLLLKKERAEAELAEVSAKRTAEVLAANTALRESEEKFRSLVETTSDCIWEVDPQGCFIYLSPQFRHLLGYDPAEFLGRSPQDLIPAEDADQVSEGFKAIVASRQPFAGLQQHNIHRDGRVLTMEISGIPIFSSAGEYQSMRGITRDITARKQAELALARSRAELEQAQALAHLGSWTLDFASNRMEWSPEVYRISGMAPGTPVDPQSHIRLVHPDDFDFFEAAWQATLQGAPYDITHRIIVAGRVKWVHARAEIAFDAEGQPQSAIGTLQDITEHKEAEDALRQSQVFLQGVLDSVSSHIAVLDRAGVIVAVNEAWRRFSRENSAEQGQLAPHTDIGTNDLSICGAAAIGREDAEEAANIRDGIRAVLDGRLPTFSLEYPCPSPHEQRWFLMTVTPLGRCGAGAVVVHTNISERKRYEQALQQARNVAETANRAKSEFLAHMSHEIRTPLNAVLGLSQVLNHEPLTADQRVMVDRIQAAGQSLLAILNDILDFSKIEAGQLRLEPRPFELGVLLAKLDSLMGQAAQAPGPRPAHRAAVGAARAAGRRCVAAGTGADQPARQRHQVHRAGRGGPPGPSARDRCDGGAAALYGPGHRHRHRARGAGPAVRALHPGRGRHYPAFRRHRPGPGDLQAAGRVDGRGNRG